MKLEYLLAEQKLTNAGCDQWQIILFTIKCTCCHQLEDARMRRLSNWIRGPAHYFSQSRFEIWKSNLLKICGVGWGPLFDLYLIWSLVKDNSEERLLATLTTPKVVFINQRKDVGGGKESMSQEIMLLEPRDSDTATVTAGEWTQRGLS